MSKAGSNLRRRIITALVGIPIITAAVFAGRLVFMALVTVVVLAALSEFRGLSADGRSKPFSWELLVFGAFLPGIAVIGGDWSGRVWLGAAILILVFRGFVAEDGWKRSAATGLGILYVGFLAGYWLKLHAIDFGRFYILSLLIATWTADTSAFIIGSRFGKRSLAPRISPNKTVEGAVGSLAVTALVMWAVPLMPLVGPAYRGLFGATMALLALLGDLFESSIKRKAGVKDTGNLIPGHGGVLDRIDSLLFTGAGAYYFIIATVGANQL